VGPAAAAAAVADGICVGIAVAGATVAGIVVAGGWVAVGWVAGAAVAGAWVAGAWVAAGVLQAESSMEAKINRLTIDQNTDFLFISLSF